MSFSLLLYRNQKKQPIKVNDEKPTNSDTSGMVTNSVKCMPPPIEWAARLRYCLMMDGGTPYPSLPYDMAGLHPVLKREHAFLFAQTRTLTLRARLWPI